MENLSVFTASCIMTSCLFLTIVVLLFHICIYLSTDTFHEAITIMSIFFKEIKSKIYPPTCLYGGFIDTARYIYIYIYYTDAYTLWSF